MNEKKSDIFEVRETNKYGKAMFATHNIQQGEKIYMLAGNEFSFDGIIKQIIDGEENIDDPLQVGDSIFLNLDETSRLFNHSCDPNGALRGRSELFAIRNIKKGEEITFDYSSVVGVNITENLWTMSCVCGAVNIERLLEMFYPFPKRRFKNI